MRSIQAWCSFMALLLGLLAAAPLRAAEDPITAPVGTALLKLPVPAGFVEPSRSVPPLRQTAERMTPPANRLLALFVDSQDEATARGGQPPAMARYFMVQAFRQAEGGKLGLADFQPVKTQLREQYRQILVQAGGQVQGQLDRVAGEIGRDAGVEGLQLKIGEMKGLEVFDEREHAISLLALSKYAIQAGERSEEVTMAMSITTAVLQGKVVYFYAYARYGGAADLDWLRSQTRAWVQRAGALNR